MSNVLQVNFKYNVSAAEYRQAADSLAEAFAAVPGCRWKIWLLDESQQAAGGVYLFDDKAALQKMLDSPLWAGVGANPALKDFSIKSWDVMDAPSSVTRAPIPASLPA
jgi:hypothetical protein